MKLKVFDRILLAILLIVAILSSFVLFAMSVNLITFDMCKTFINQFYAVRQNMLILAGSGLVILLISIKLLFAGRGDKKANAPATALIRQGEIGGTFIALSAIDIMVKKFCSTHGCISDCQTSIKNSDAGVTIGLRVSLLSDTDVVSVTTELQRALKEHVETLTGVTVKEVSILVEDANVGNSAAPVATPAAVPSVPVQSENHDLPQQMG